MSARAAAVVWLGLSMASGGCRAVSGVDDHTFYPTCIPGTTRACTTGPDESVGRGACKAGAQTCAEDGTSWGPCTGDVVPAPADDCASGLDLDCDGAPPSACTGSIQWVRALASSSTDVAGGVGADSAQGVTVAGSVDGDLLVPGVTLPIESGTTALLAGYQPDGDLAWATGEDGPLGGDPPVTETRRHYGLEVLGTEAFTFLEGSGVLALQKFSTATGIAGWTAAGVPYSSDDPGAVAASADAVWVAATTTASAGTMLDVGGVAGPAAAGGGDVVLLRFTHAGGFQSAQVFGDDQKQVARSVAVDASGGVVLAGCFTGAVDLGCGALTAAETGAFDAFIAVLAGDGTCLGGRTFPIAVSSTSPCRIVARAAAGGGVAWALSHPTSDGAATTLRVGRTDATLEDAWTQAFEGDLLAADAAGIAATTDPYGNVLVAASFDGQLTVDDLTIGDPEVTTPRAVVVKLAAQDGRALWSTTLTGATLAPRGVAASPLGHVLVTGQFEGAVSEGPAPHPTTSGDAIFVASLAP